MKAPIISDRSVGGKEGWEHFIFTFIFMHLYLMKLSEIKLRLNLERHPSLKDSSNRAFCLSLWHQTISMVFY